MAKLNSFPVDAILYFNSSNIYTLYATFIRLDTSDGAEIKKGFNHRY